MRDKSGNNFEIPDYGNNEFRNEMATVGRILECNFQIIVTPYPNRIETYFTVFDHVNYAKCKKVVCISFKEAKIFNHWCDDSKQLWTMTAEELGQVVIFLKSPAKTHYTTAQYDVITNWNLAIHLWGNECGYNFDDNYKDHPQYISTSIPMPDYTTEMFKDFKK